MPVMARPKQSVLSQIVPEKFRPAMQGLESALSTGDPGADAMLSMTGPIGMAAAPAAKGAHWLGGLAERAIAGEAGNEAMQVGTGLGRKIVAGVDLDNVMALKALRDAAKKMNPLTWGK